MARTEEAITGYLQAALSGRIHLREDVKTTNVHMIGHGLSYYLTEILKKLKDPNIKDKWIDAVEWKSFDLLPPHKLKGSGKLWWGFKKDSLSKTFPDDFFCELKLDKSKNKTGISFLFQFQMDGKSFNLKS